VADAFLADAVFHCLVFGWLHWLSAAETGHGKRRSSTAFRRRRKNLNFAVVVCPLLPDFHQALLLNPWDTDGGAPRQIPAYSLNDASASSGVDRTLCDKLIARKRVLNRSGNRRGASAWLLRVDVVVFVWSSLILFLSGTKRGAGG